MEIEDEQLGSKCNVNEMGCKLDFAKWGKMGIKMPFFTYM